MHLGGIAGALLVQAIGGRQSQDADLLMWDRIRGNHAMVQRPASAGPGSIGPTWHPDCGAAGRHGHSEERGQCKARESFCLEIQLIMIHANFHYEAHCSSFQLS